MLESTSRLGRRVGRELWTLKRFGLSPGKIPRRVLNRAEPKILCISPPKSGTHLLERALCLHPRLYRKIMPTIGERNVQRWGGLNGILSRMRPGQVAVSHLMFKPARVRALEKQGARCIFLVRDPRDMVVSRVFHIAKDVKHPLHEQFRSETDLGKLVRWAIEGDEDLRSLRKMLEDFAGWLDSGALVVRFEELIGPAGGGDEIRQALALRRVFEHVGVEVTEDQLASIRSGVFSNRSPTFRRGEIGDYRRYFNDDTRELFREAAGDLLARYAYELEPGW
jgi:sulfotransferase family protein